MIPLLTRLGTELENNNKVSEAFIEAELASPHTVVEHGIIGDSCRVCVITLPGGHKLVGHALVLDPVNDDEIIGQSVAYKNASEKIWETYGAVAKALMELEVK